MANGPTILDRRKSGTGVATETADHGGKTPFLTKPKAGKIPSFPGDYELQKLTLTSPNRKGYIDLKGAWSDFNIYEDLFGNYLTGNIQLVDGVGLMESVPIIGEETIHIQVRTKGIVRERNQQVIPGPFEGSQNEGMIKLKFRVVKISDIIKMNDAMVTFKLSFVSEEAILNLKQKVKKSSLDPTSLEPRKISDVINSLYRQFFKKGRTAKKLFVEPTKNLTDLIIPNQTPFKAFNFLASRAVSAGKHALGSSFVFYESVRGYFFVSMETLMAGGGMGYSTVPGVEGSPTELVFTAPEDPVKETYVVQPKRLNAKGNEATNVAVEMTAVDSYSFSSNFDVLQNLSKGMYANRLLTHDLVRMKYDTLDFNLVDPTGEQVKVNEDTGGTEVLEFNTLAADAKNFGDSFTHLGTGKLATEKQDALGSPESMISFYPTNFAHDVRFKEALGSAGVKGEVKADARPNIIPNRVEQWMQSRLVQGQQAANIKLNIRAPGLSTRAVGDLIEFKMPTQYTEDRDGFTQSSHHTYLSGYYLITKLRHHFTAEKYEIEFEAIKDSLKVPPGKDRSVPEADDTTNVNRPPATVNPVTGRTGPK
tara:strand:- start:725 stop:2500 length:1776 start_codon:yes stop_codon:yes gene_type:complete